MCGSSDGRVSLNQAKDEEVDILQHKVFLLITQADTNSRQETIPLPRRTHEKILLISLLPWYVFPFHHQPRKAALLALGHPLNLTHTIRGKRGHRNQFGELVSAIAIVCLFPVRCRVRDVVVVDQI